jgi:hypothetical protein
VCSRSPLDTASADIVASEADLEMGEQSLSNSGPNSYLFKRTCHHLYFIKLRRSYMRKYSYGKYITERLKKEYNSIFKQGYSQRV